MSTLKVCDGLEIMNASESAFNEMKRRNNTLEEGASFILEALSEFAETQYDAHKYDPSISYKNLFFALKQIIDSASNDENTRNALLVGLVHNKGYEFKEPEKTVEEEKPQGVYVRNKAAIAKYAKNHTAREVQKHFKFSSNLSAKQYMRSNHIKFVEGERGRPSIDLDYVKVSELAKTMRLCELSRAFACTKEQMMYFCRKNQIEYQRPAKGVING